MSAELTHPRCGMPFHELAARGLLWHGGHRVSLNVLDASLCVDVYQAYLKKRSKLYVYPIPAHVLPSLIVATLLVNTFGRSLNRSLVPRVLFYTGIDGRDLYRDLGVGVQREKISETFGFIRLDSDGLPIEHVNLTTQLPLVVTGHCVLPKDKGYRPDVIVVDADAFEARALAALIEAAAQRWSTARFYVVASNPISPLIAASSRLGWRLADLLHTRVVPNGATPSDIEFGSVAAQLQQLQKGVNYRSEVVAAKPAPSWPDLEDSLSIARKHQGTSRAARQFVAIVRLFVALPVLPSEYDAYRTANMLTLEQRLQSIRDEARREGKVAQLIAGGCSVLSDVCAELEQRNWKRESLLEAVLESCYSGRSVALLVERAGMRAVLAEAVQLLPECIDMVNEGRLRILAGADVSRATRCDTVIVPGIFSMSEMWVLRTMIAPEMLFLSYSLEASLQTWCLREIGLLDARSSLAPTEEESLPEPPETPSEDILEVDLGELLVPKDGSAEESISTSAQIAVGPRREIWFDDGTCSIVPDATSLQVVIDAEEPLQAKRARSIEPGDWLVIVNGDAQQSLFEALREHVDSKTALSQAIHTVKGFHHALRTAFSAAAITVEQLHARIVELGSDIRIPASVMQWIDGTRFGPSDAKDISRLGAALSIELFQTRYSGFFRAMQRVRVAHRELGRVLVRVIKDAYRERDSKSVRITVDGETVVLYDVLEAVTLKRVTQVKEVR
jgi:hypothetical protein